MAPHFTKRKILSPKVAKKVLHDWAPEPSLIAPATPTPYSALTTVLSFLIWTNWPCPSFKRFFFTSCTPGLHSTFRHRSAESTTSLPSDITFSPLILNPYLQITGSPHPAFLGLGIPLPLSLFVSSFLKNLSPSNISMYMLIIYCSSVPTIHKVKGLYQFGTPPAT